VAEKLRLLVVGGGSRAARAFVALASRQPDLAVTVLARRPQNAVAGETVIAVTDYFSPPEDVLRGADVVVNLAGLVKAPLPLLTAVNVEGAARLAEAARAAGVRQFIHVSSFSVYGFASDIGSATPEHPVTDYGRSKQAGDRALLALETKDFAVALLRVPILYSHSARGKLHQLAAAMVRLGWFPVPAVLPRRAVMHLQNLAAAILAVARQGRRGILFAADPENFTIQSLTDALAHMTNRRVRLVRAPGVFFQALKRLTPGLYHSVYGDSIIRQGEALTYPGALPLRDTLRDVVDQEVKKQA
jgi:UDP-glucose 4-epimerase